jgi:hypothetical protein
MRMDIEFSRAFTIGRVSNWLAKPRTFTLYERFSGMTQNYQGVCVWSTARNLTISCVSYVLRLISIYDKNCPGPSDETGKTEALCHSRWGTMKIPPCSKALSTEHRPIFCSPSPVMVTSPYKWKILEWDLKQWFNNQSIWWSSPGGGGSSYILVYTDVPLEWGAFLTSQIYQWDAIFTNLLYQWVDNFACHYTNGW